MIHEQFLGKYQLIAEIARGGMGIVYLALVQGAGGFSKLVVVKELKTELVEDDSYLDMFLDEAKLAARLNHPNIVQTNEVGNEGERHYMAMDYLDGRTYERVRRRSKTAGNPFMLPMHLKLFVDVLGALEYAHSLANFDGAPLQIVHRDVSPNNVFVTFDGHIKMLDFGIAKSADHNHETVAGAVKGKLAYMAPEQARGEHVDHRADLFSVGVMMWEAIAGRKLRTGGHDEVVRSAAGAELPRLATVVPDVDPELEAIIASATANHRDARYGTAGEMQEALEKYLAKTGGIPTARELAAVIASLFADERAKTNALVEAAMTRARNGAEAAADLPVIELSGGGSGGGGGNALRSNSASFNTPTPRPPHPAGSTDSNAPTPTFDGAPAAPGPTVEQVSAPPPRRGRAAWIAVGIIAATALVGYAATRDRSGRPVATEASLPTPQASPEPLGPLAPPVQPAAATRPAATREPIPAANVDPATAVTEAVTVDIRATPSTSTISVDDAQVVGNPFRGNYRRDALMHHIRATAPGYTPAIRDVPFDSNVRLELALQRTVAVAAPRGHKRGRPDPSTAPATVPTPTAPPPAPTATATPNVPPPTQTPAQVDPNGGQRPHRSIDTKNPYQ